MATFLSLAMFLVTPFKSFVLVLVANFFCHSNIGILNSTPPIFTTSETAFVRNPVLGSIVFSLDQGLVIAKGCFATSKVNILIGVVTKGSTP